MNTSPVILSSSLKSHVATHVFYIVGIAFMVLCGRIWLQEHDARMATDAKLAVSQKQEQALQAQITQLNAQAAVKVAAVKKQVAAIKTTPQAIAAIPSLSSLPLMERAIPAIPDAVAVNAVALAQELGECKEAEINLGACEQTNTRMAEIHTEDQQQIMVLRKKPKFWRRVGSTIKSGSIFISIGVVIAKVLL